MLFSTDQFMFYSVKWKVESGKCPPHIHRAQGDLFSYCVLSPASGEPDLQRFKT